MSDLWKEVPARKEDYRFHATATSRNGTSTKALARLWLPKTVDGPISLFLYPGKRREDQMKAFNPPFTISGRLPFSPGRTIRFQASEVWSKGWTRHGMTLPDVLVHAEPIDLTVTITNNRRQPTTKVTTTTAYHLTRHSLLLPHGIIGQHPTDGIKVEHGKRRPVPLGKGKLLRFERRYNYETTPDGILMADELLAIIKNMVPRAALTHFDPRELEAVDDLLALASFATRESCLCIGITKTTADADTITLYRKDRASMASAGEPFDVLVYRSKLEAFLGKAYRRFTNTGPDPLLRHALHMINNPRKGTLDSSFLSYFAAIETILLWFRQRHDLEYIFPNAERKQLRTDLDAFLQQHELFTPRTKRRRQQLQLLRRNLSGLQRVPLADVLNAFCRSYKLDLRDLWPIFAATNPRTCLNGIRNRLIHGYAYRHDQYGAVMVALQHLEWTAERILLAVLKWPITESTVAPDDLKDFIAMIDWKTEHESLAITPAPQ